MNLDKMKEMCERVCVDGIKELGTVPARVYIVSTDAKFFCFMYDPTPDKKERLQEMIVGLIRFLRLAGRFSACGIAGEMWMGRNLNKRPSTDPERREGVFYYCRDEKDQVAHVWEIERDTEHKPRLIELESEKQPATMESCWLDQGFDPLPASIPDDMREAAQRALDEMPAIFQEAPPN